MKKIIAALMFLILVLVSLSKYLPGDMQPSTAGSYETDETHLYLENNIPAHAPENKPLPPVSAYTAETVSAAKKAILRGIENIDSEIDLSSFGISTTAFTSLYCSIINANPHLFYVVGDCVYSRSGNTVTSVKPEYTGSKQEILQKKILFDKAVEKALAAIPKNISNVEKVLAVNDYIVNTSEYDETLSRTSAYDLLVDKTAVCGGYGFAFGVLMDKLGIENRFVVSPEMEHGWNMVKLDGKWYHVDVTWNDPSPNELGRVSHNYLLLSDSVISDPEHEHYGWDTDVSAASDVYLNAFWTNVNTAMIYNGGKWYYIQSPDGLKHSILAFNPADGVVSVLHTFETRWSIEKNSYWERTSFLAEYGGKLYYNTSNAIYSIDFNGSNNTEILSETLKDSNAIYEMCITGSELRYRIRSAPAAYGLPEYEEKVFNLK